jgi:hypothetical protein
MKMQCSKEQPIAMRKWTSWLRISLRPCRDAKNGNQKKWHQDMQVHMRREDTPTRRGRIWVGRGITPSGARHDILRSQPDNTNLRYNWLAF